jgi:hypothetical protein
MSGRGLVVAVGGGLHSRDKEAIKRLSASPRGGGSKSLRTFLLGLAAGWCLHYLRDDAASLLLLPAKGGWQAMYHGGYVRNVSCDSSLRPPSGNSDSPGGVEVARREEEDKEGGADESDDGGDNSNDGDDYDYDYDSRSASLPTFTDLVNASGSDKFERHHFERYYTPWLEPYRHVPGLKILEIGARDGKSLTLWDKYFTNASLILGLAYKDGTDKLPERLVGMKHNVSLYYGDQSELESMRALAEYGPFDIIIDDGSHVPEHVVFSLFSLWDRAVKPGGLYVIEDIETSYWRNGSRIYGYTIIGTGIGAKPEYSVVTKLEQIQQVLFRHQIGARNLINLLPGDKDLCSVEWGMNLAALRKCDDDRLGFAKPPFQPSCVNEAEMKAWVKEARRTNPTGYLGEVAKVPKQQQAPNEAASR